MSRSPHLVLIVLILPLSVYARKPATQPTGDDPALEFLLNQASTEPATRPVPLPTTKPASVLKSENADDGFRAGTILLSDGTTLHARIATTAEKPVRVWDDAAAEYRDIPFPLIGSIEAKILWERDEKEWRFKEGGSDIKEYSGKTYPARETQYVFTLINGQTITGGVVAPLYVDADGKQQTLVLDKRAKGDPGQTLLQLVYVKRVDFP